MKHFILAAGFLAMAAMGCDSKDKKADETSTTTSGDTTTTAAANTTAPVAPLPDSVQMKNWIAYATPGEMQKMMASWNGTWNGKVRMWQKPGLPADSSNLTTTNKMIMNGRYQVSNHSGSMMGMPFEGMGTLAYDNAKRIFISTWIDNMGSGLMTMEGTWDPGSKTMTMTGKGVDPASGTGREVNMREIFKVMDDNHQLMEMYGPDSSGREYKVMEIAFTKK
jgi:hypothetical protein